MSAASDASLLAHTPQQVGLITDSTCDLPPELLAEYDVAVTPLRLFLDGEAYLDKVGMSSAEFNRRLPTVRQVRTSPPAPGDINKVYTAQLARYPNVVALHVVALYSGTFQAALGVAGGWKGVAVRNTHTVSAGLGLVVLEAAKRARNGLDAEQILAEAVRDCARVRVFVSMDTVEFAVRSGRIGPEVGRVARWLGIKPVIEFASREEGKILVAAKAFGRRWCESALLRLVAREAAKQYAPRFAITHVGAPATAERYATALRQRFGADPLYVMEASSALGIHSGPGACAVCFLGDEV